MMNHTTPGQCLISKSTVCPLSGRRCPGANERLPHNYFNAPGLSA